jgi:inorganic triphosphatase YgiF
MADSDPVETELKFLIEAGVLPKLRAHPLLAGPKWEERLRSVYFDTPQGDLRDAGYSLRVRKTGAVFMQTVKACGPSLGFARGEWERQVRSSRPDLAALAQTPAGGTLNGGEAVLQPVFTTTVRRTSWLWRGGGDIVELSLDQGEVRAKDRRTRICELELELKSGASGALFDLAREVGGAVPIRLSFDSKAERGFRLARDEAPEAVAVIRPEVSAEMSVAETFRRIARACLAQTVANAEVLRQVRRPEALHQMRVGLRRFRAAMTAFAPMLTGPDMDMVKAETEWLAGELDGARDEDVFMHSTFQAAADRAEGDAGFAALGKRLIEVQSRAYERAMSAINSQRASALLLEACAWAEAGDWARNGDPGAAAMRERPIESFAGAALDHRLASVRKRARGLEQLDAESRHKLRIKAKKLRYAAEFLAPVFGRHRRKRARNFLSRLEAMQDALGELNDIAVARRKALADAGPDAETAFAAGRAVGRREHGERALIKAAAAAAEGLRDAKPFWRS